MSLLSSNLTDLLLAGRDAKVEGSMGAGALSESDDEVSILFNKCTHMYLHAYTCTCRMTLAV